MVSDESHQKTAEKVDLIVEKFIQFCNKQNDLFLYSVSSSQGVTFDAGSLLLFAVGT